MKNISTMTLWGINPFTKKYYAPRKRFHKNASRKNRVAVNTMADPETILK